MEDIELQVPSEDHLRARTKRIGEKLTEALAPASVVVEKPWEKDGEWKQTIRIRRGARAGVDLDVTWARGAETAKLALSTASKLESALTLGFALPLGFVTAIMGMQHVPPLDFLPGKKIAAALGGMIGLIAGMIVALIFVRIFADHAASDELLAAARDAVISPPPTLKTKKKRATSGRLT